MLGCSKVLSMECLCGMAGKSGPSCLLDSHVCSCLLMPFHVHSPHNLSMGCSKWRERCTRIDKDVRRTGALTC